MKIASWIAALTIGLAFAATDMAIAQTADQKVTVKLSRQEVYEGDAVAYRIQLYNLPDSTQPQLDGFDDFRVEGPSRSVRQSTFQDGFRRTTQVIVTYEYLLYPRKSGRLTIPAPKIVHQGNTYTGKPLTLLVKPPSAQDLVVVTLTSDLDDVYLTQPFTLTIKVYVKQLPGAYRQEDPVTILREHPQLQIPWLDDDELPKGVTPGKDWRTWLRQFSTLENRGFSINGLSVSEFFSSRTVAFQFPTRLVQRPDKDGQRAYYWEYTAKRTFSANRVGKVTFDRVTLKGMFIRSITGRAQVQGERIATYSQPVTVQVNDGPQVGRPSTYIGVVGRMSAKAELSPTSLQVGQPTTLELTLEGSGSLDNAVPPDLSRIPAIEENFKLYEATSRSEKNRRSFVYSLRPKRAELKTFPPIELSYFDIEKAGYVTLKTEPISIDIADTETLGGGDIVTGGRADGRPVEVRKDGIYANITEFTKIRDQSVNPQFWFSALLGMAGAFLAAVVAGRYWRLQNDDVAGRRRKGAEAKSRQAILVAGQLDSRPQAEALTQALTTAIAEVAGESPEGYTRDDVLRQLTDWSIDATTRQRVAEWLDDCDAARFAGFNPEAGTLATRAAAIHEELFSQLRQKRLLK